jgi:integrase
LEGKAAKSIVNDLGLLGAIYGHACRRGWCDRNPVADVERPRHGRRDLDIRFLTLTELEALLGAVPDSQLGQTERVAYLAAALSGMRRGELLALRWMDVDWQAGLVRVRRNYTHGAFGTPKSRRSSRAIPLAARLQQELQAHQARSAYTSELDLVFCHPATGRVLDPSKLYKRFKATAARAGLRPVRFHDLRHTFGTRMAAAGAPLRAVQEWMGHSDYRTTSLYAHYAPDLTNANHWATQAFGTGEPNP